MSEINRTALFGKLNSLGYKAIEGATVFCKLRGNPYVEFAHWLHHHACGSAAAYRRPTLPLAKSFACATNATCGVIRSPSYASYPSTTAALVPGVATTLGHEYNIG